MFKLDKTELTQILESITKPDKEIVKDLNKPSEARGKERDFEDITIFRIFLLMYLVKAQTIKGVWKYLSENSDIAQACGLTRLPDRSTLSRRLGKLNIKDWI